MALIGINTGEAGARKPSALEQIAMGVDIASKVLGTGMQAYQAFGPGADLQRAQTEHFKADAAKSLAEASALGAKKVGELSDVDKQIINSYKDYNLTHEKGANENSVAVYLPVSGRTIYATPAGMTKEKAFDQESKLRNEFRTDQAVQAFRTIHGATKAVTDAFADRNFEKGDAGKDIALLYNFIKIMDPNSTVREGEVSLTTGASPILDQAVQSYRKLYSDKAALLPPSLRKSLISSIADNYKSREADFKEVVNHYKTISSANGVDWNKVIVPLTGLNVGAFQSKSPDEAANQKQNFLKKFGGTP